MRHVAAYTGITVPRGGPEEREVQIIQPRKPYVYGTNRNNALIHKIRQIRLRWWGFAYGYMYRLQSPRMTAVTYCQRYISIDSTKGKMCEMPKEDAVLCAACHGKGRNFPRGEKHEVSKELAKVRLGCVETPL